MSEQRNDENQEEESSGDVCRRSKKKNQRKVTTYVSSWNRKITYLKVSPLGAVEGPTMLLSLFLIKWAQPFQLLKVCS